MRDLLSVQDDGIVVVKVEKGLAMDLGELPASLQQRLGLEATGGLLQLFELAHRAGRAEMIGACAERFERRLSEEIAGVRVQMAEGDASLRHQIVQTGAEIRQQMVQMGAEIRQETGQMGAGIRREMAQMGAGVRQERVQMGADIRQEMVLGRVELLKWCFLFWIGQVVAVGTLMSVMLRLIR